MTEQEEWITSRDNVPIYTKTWKTVKSPIATIVFVHGFGENIKRYDYVFSRFSKMNIEVYAYDQRGNGETALRNKNPGITGGFEVLTGDVTDALVAKRKPGIPQFLMGHSEIVFNYACVGPEKDNLCGYIICSPFFQQGDKTKKPAFLTFTVVALSKVIPNLTIPVNLDPKYLSHDPEIVKSYVEDPLNNGVGSLETHMATVPKFLVNNKKYEDITLPIYFSHGSEDHITSPTASKEIFEKITVNDKTYREWKGLYHELHNEYEKDQVIDEYIKWIIDHVANKTTN
ncbi:8458_t:CDS:2 [Diversispora eburnea]|uniref:8458_t:CDS:1 n=1 Tax=Diversispora eburnea TaxID=1213867 RepID=A0A9N9F4E0_9GLOM|nr:8458_t:CDS:2 [Diversispora eburnea]